MLYNVLLGELYPELGLACHHHGKQLPTKCVLLQRCAISPIVFSIVKANLNRNLLYVSFYVMHVVTHDQGRC